MNDYLTLNIQSGCNQLMKIKHQHTVRKCRKTFKLSKMTETVIKSNMEGPKHVANCKPVNCVFKPKAISKSTSSRTVGEPTA